MGNTQIDNEELISEKLKNFSAQKGVMIKKRELKLETTYKKLKEIKKIQKRENFQNLKPRLKKNQNHKILFSKKNDRRKKIQTPEKFPFSPTGVVSIKFGEDTYYGTGIIIYPMIVLTAGHNVYDHKNKEKAYDIKFTPCPNGKKNKFGTYKVLEFFFCEEFKINQEEDFAILILDKGVNEFALGLYTGFFGLKIVEDLDFLESKEIFLYGYPDDKRVNDLHEMWGMGYKVEDDDNTLIEHNGIINHDIDTWAGQSGSGILLKENGNFYVIGIHFSGGNKYNYGVLITKKD